MSDLRYDFDLMVKNHQERVRLEMDIMFLKVQIQLSDIADRRHENLVHLNALLLKLKDELAEMRI